MSWQHEASIILDLTTFKLVKNRYGANDVDPAEAYAELCRCLADNHSKILLLTD